MSEIDRSAVQASAGLFSHASEADAAEQRRPVVDDSAAAMERLRVPFEADPVDAMDQLREVPIEEDDYR
jgi:hypothetical protein